MRILNFGSLNIDFVYTVDHFVMPGETLSSFELNKFCGGKGLNQSIALARAGATVFHAGKIGTDGEMLQKRLKNNGVDTRFLITDEYIPTGHAIIQVDKHGQNCIILYGGANKAITEADVDGVLENFERGDLLLLQNEISCTGYILTKAHEKGMRIALNPSPISEELLKLDELKYVEWFILNEVEGEQLSGSSEPLNIVNYLFERFDGAKSVLTLGKRGVVYSDGVTTEKHGIYSVPVVDTTAAGDTFTGYFLASVCEGCTVKEALRRASIASSIAVSRNGASDSIPTSDEVEHAELTPAD